MNKNTHLEKHRVCTSCFSIGTTDPNCICCNTDNYDTIELEFEICNCCGNPIEDGTPADSIFNTTTK